MTPNAKSQDLNPHLQPIVQGSASYKIVLTENLCCYNFIDSSTITTHSFSLFTKTLLTIFTPPYYRLLVSFLVNELARIRKPCTRPLQILGST